jgi:hypothetical protein
MRKIFTAAALLLASAGAQANLISNGSFETPNVGNGSWTIVNSLAGWNVGSGGVEIRNNAVGSAFDGLNFIELDTTGNSSISQNIAAQASGLFSLTLAYAPRAGVGSASNGIDIYWDGGLLASLNGSGIGNGGNVWQSYAFQFNVFAGVHTLRFVAVGNSDSLGGSLDAIHLVAVQPEPAEVSEPAGLAMMGLGLLTLAGLCRRRSK